MFLPKSTIAILFRLYPGLLLVGQKVLGKKRSDKSSYKLPLHTNLDMATHGNLLKLTRQNV
jgi:hypothetical protein